MHENNDSLCGKIFVLISAFLDTSQYSNIVVDEMLIININQNQNTPNVFKVAIVVAPFALST